MMAGDYTPVQQSGTTAAPPQYITKLVSMYQQSHPGFKVDWVVLNNGGQSDTDVWITTQLAGGNPPDIINWQSARIEGILKEKVFQPLDSYLAKPNPYEPGNTQWLASFNPLIMPGKKLVDGQQYVIPLDLVVTGIIYNKQAFAKAGITTPGDWKAWMDQTPVVKSKADLVPISWWMTERRLALAVELRLFSGHLPGQETVVWRDHRSAAQAKRQLGSEQGGPGSRRQEGDLRGDDAGVPGHPARLQGLDAGLHPRLRRHRHRHRPALLH